MSSKFDDMNEKVEAAFRAAGAAAIERARLTDTPVIVWEDGRIKEIPWQELVELEKQLKAEVESWKAE